MSHRGTCQVCGGVDVQLLQRRPICVSKHACLQRWQRMVDRLLYPRRSI